MKKLLAVLGVLRILGVLGIGVGVLRVLGAGGLVVLGVIHEIYLLFLYLRYRYSVTAVRRIMQKNIRTRRPLLSSGRFCDCSKK